jgi:hypothetical protein
MRGSYRGGGGGRGGGYGGHGDRESAKTDGKKNAIAETIAMMNKMKMEEKQKKSAAEERRARMREQNPELVVPTTEELEAAAANAQPLSQGRNSPNCYEDLIRISLPVTTTHLFSV